MPPGDQRRNPEATADETAPPPENGLCPGDVLGQYRLHERIGAGGMGQVFKAVHATMQRTVAIKIMAPNLMLDARARARFLREVRSTARLTHPNIVLAYDAAEADGRCFLVMEYVEGRDAAALLDEYGLPPVPIACAIIRQAALGLQHAHEAGMVHRDIKPGNLVIAVRSAPTPPGTPGPGPPHGWPVDPTTKVLDFGLARFQAGEATASGHVPGSTPLTREGHVVGTPEFMAPEQACNSPKCDIRADIYSLGCTFYCLLTGRPPFVGPSLLEIMVQHLQSAFPPVTQLRPDVPPGVVAVLERMLAKRPEDRYQQPAEVAAALLPWVAAAGAGACEVVVPGQPIHVFAETEACPELAGPGATAATVAAPTPAQTPAAGPQTQPGQGPATGRHSIGCLALFLILLASMIVGWFFLPRPDRGQPAVPPDDIPHPGPLAGMMLVRFPHG
ncbi:MAG: serine/threonine-protein kinase, partial [Streptosporangiales bacterium]